MSDTDAQAADSGILSIDEAVADMDRRDTENTQAASEAVVEAETPPADAAAEQDTEAATTAEEEGSEAEAPGDANDEPGEEETQAEALRLDPPNWWNAEQKAKWASLSPELQAVVYAQEQNRENVLQKAKTKAAEAEKTFTDQRAQIATRMQVLDELLPRAMEMYGNRWANVDWAAAAAQMDPTDYNRVRAQYEQETRHIHQMAAEKRSADDEAFKAFATERAAKLVAIAPELADAKEGPARQQRVVEFLVSNGGLTQEQVVRGLTADVASLLHDGLRYRDAAANAKANPVPKIAPKANTVKPTATPPVRTPNHARIAELTRKSRLTTDEAVELMNLKGTG